MAIGDQQSAIIPSVAEISGEQDRRRAELLLKCAQMLHSHLDVTAVVASLAERVQELLDVRLVCVVLRRGEEFRLEALATCDAQLTATVQEAGPDCRFAHEIANRALMSGEPVGIAVSGLDIADLSYSPGYLLAVPLRAASAAGALVVYGSAPFHAEDRTVVAAVAAFAAVALDNAELYARANAQTREVQQLLDITAELSSAGKLSQFLEKFVVLAAEFLGFERSFLALAEGNECEIRWLSRQGVAQPMRLALPQSVALRVEGNSEPFWTNDVRQWAGMAQEPLAGPMTRQCLCVPLLSGERSLLGVLGVLDRCDGQNVSPEEVRRARSLAAEVAVVLQTAQALHEAEEQRHRAENLTRVALEVNATLRLPQFAESFAQRAADVLDAGAAVLAVAYRNQLDTIALFDRSRTVDPQVRFRLNAALNRAAEEHSEAIVAGPASALLGASLAEVLGWDDLTLARLGSPDGDLLGLLCVANRHLPLAPQDRDLIQALVAHAAVGLENARLFTRMDQANRHWMEIFDAITDLIVVHDEQLRILRVNRSLADFIGVAPAELIGVSMRAMIAMAADHGTESCPFCRVVSGGDEYVHPVLDRAYLVSTSRVHGANNEPMQTIHVLKDISDRREAERRYRELFDTIQEGLFFSTPEGRFIEVNDALVRMLGYESREDLLGVDITNAIYMSSDQRTRFREQIDRSGMVRNYQEVLRRRDGSIIHTLQNAFAVRDSSGEVVQYRGLMLDITELRTFQAELQRQRDFNNKILDNTQSFILVADTAGLISYANKRCFETGGYLQEELLGRKLIDLIPLPRRQSFLAALSETLAGRQVDNLELPILLGQGRSGQFSINLSPMRDEAGLVNSIVVVMTDINDAAELRAKLMHTEKMAAVGQLVSGVAHEVNNPLTAVLGFTDLLLDNPDIPENAKNDLKVVLHEAQRTKQIVQNLLSFARQMPPQRQQVQVNLVLRRTLALRSYDFANHGVQIIERIEDGVPEILGDSHQLQQVFLNILNNAYDAVHETGRQGRIEIGTGVAAGYAEVTFRDNGHGIAYPEKIFDPFFTTKDVGKGTGLGLSICYGIVREHGGEILCRNNGDTPGATFTVRLPLAQTRAAAAGSDL